MFRVSSIHRANGCGEIVGVPERVAMKDTGHKTQSVLDRNHILGPLDLQEMARKLTGIIGQTGIDTNGVTLGMSLVL